MALGAKHGALQKGLVQDHERPDVVAVRIFFVGMWIMLMSRMFVYRPVDVAEAKKFMPLLKDGAEEPFTGNESKFMEGLNLHKVKEETPNDSELCIVEKWAGVHCKSSARSTIASSEDETVLIEADKLDHIGHGGTEVLGPLQTKGGVSFTMKDGKFRLVDPETGVTLTAAAVKVTCDGVDA